jgi:uncharacterized membrane protein (UPF0136 family)
MTPNTVLWIYIVFLIIGGLIGFLKAGSKMSIITSSISALLLALCALNVFPPVVAKVLIGLLVVVFAMRLAKTGKFMPSGLMIVMSVAALAALLFLR